MLGVIDKFMTKELSCGVSGPGTMELVARATAYAIPGE